MQKENAQITDAVQAVSIAIANALALSGQPSLSTSDENLRKAVCLALYKGFNLGREATIDVLPTSVQVDVYEGDLNICGEICTENLSAEVSSQVDEAEAEDYEGQDIVDSIINEANQPTAL